MESLTINAVVLHETLYKESDVILKVLTAEKGVISVSAKGVKSIKSKNKSALQLFCYSELELAYTKDRYVVKSANLIEQFYNVRNDLDAFALACYIAETALHFSSEENDESETLRLVLNSFYALNMKENKKPFWQIKASYEIKLSSVSGFMPQVSFCTCCGNELASLNENENKLYVFSLSEGGVLCADCAKNLSDSTKLMLSNITLEAIKYISASDIKRFLSFKLDDSKIIEFTDFAERYILNLAERRFETLKYYKSLLNQQNL